MVIDRDKKENKWGKGKEGEPKTLAEALKGRCVAGVRCNVDLRRSRQNEQKLILNWNEIMEKEIDLTLEANRARKGEAGGWERAAHG